MVVLPVGPPAVVDIEEDVVSLLVAPDVVVGVTVVTFEPLGATGATAVEPVDGAGVSTFGVSSD